MMKKHLSRTYHGPVSMIALALLLLLSTIPCEAHSPFRSRLPGLTMVTTVPRGGAAAPRGVAHLKKASAKGPAARPSTAVVSSGGDSTMANQVFNLVKAILGVGVLSLPSGVAAFGNAPSALIPAVALIATMGGLSAYGFALIGRVCSFTGAKSYREAWTLSVGPTTSWIPAWSATIKTAMACLAYSMVLADTFTALFQRTGQRTAVLITLTSSVLLPLCWLKNLNSLSVFSMVGVMGMGYTALAMTLRWWDGSYLAPAGALLSGLAPALRPKFGTTGWEGVWQPQSLILASMLSTSFMSHFLAPKFYRELQNNTLPRFQKMVSLSFGISILLFATIACVGFATFGQHSSGLILNNYAHQDTWMSLSRIAVATSLIFSYPLVFQGFRDGTLDVLGVSLDQVDTNKKNTILNVTTITLLSLLTFLAVVLKDVSFVLAFGGATLGNLLTYVYPALMYRAITKKQGRDEKLPVAVATFSGVLGVVMGSIGAKMALNKLSAH